MLLEVEIFGFFRDCYTMWCFLGSFIMKGNFAGADTWEDVLLRTDTGVFLESTWKEGIRWLLKQMLERKSSVWKLYKYNPTDSGWCCVVLFSMLLEYFLVLPWLSWYWSSVMMLYIIMFLCLHCLLLFVKTVGRNVWKNFWWHSGSFLLILWTWAN